jgi:GT2 family glycosyltransferase
LENNNLKIAVIIVNYNVEYFLEQCLNSVQKALKNVSGEVYVVDNNSIDGSVEMVRQKFPNLHLIANKHNLGFSKANNQAMEITQAEYVLLLNPDTVVEEDTFEKVIAFMDQHPEAGGLGVRMLDGKGKFLPESKRGLPTPSVAFYKIFGFSKLFPTSKRFGQYHLGYLSEFETNEVEILSGAFMLMRKKTLDKVGLLDEAFFMYGEDIDLSYRIILGGYKNYYFPETRIIHYKGESTKKSSVNYVFVFYRAMVIFAEKHFSQKNAKLFSILINLAIYLRAGLAILARFFKKSALLIFDSICMTAGLWLLTQNWQRVNIEFPSEIIHYAIPSYAIIWIVSIIFQGGYDYPTRFNRYLKGSILGTLIILVGYALLPKDWQFSRLYILLGAAWVFLYYLISRLFLHLSIGRKFDIIGAKNQLFLIVGTHEETARVAEILKQTTTKIESILFVSSTEEKNELQIGTISQLDQIVFIHNVDEIIFCAKDTSAQEILEWMSRLGSSHLDFKIAQPESLSLIGSNSIDTAGDLYVLNINQIATQSNVRNKRTLDLVISFVGLTSFPISCWFFKNKLNFLRNLTHLLLGKKSTVGYAYVSSEKNETGNQQLLPKLKSGILNPLDQVKKTQPINTSKLNLIYARDYSIWKDLEIIRNAWQKLDR